MIKAAVLNQINSYPEIQEIDLRPKSGDVAVSLKASALNHRDLWITKGMYPGISFPIVLGSDGVGMHDGKEVIINPGWNWGQSEKAQAKNFSVLGLPENGCFSEMIHLDPKYLHHTPSHLSLHESAALPLAGVTAFRALVTRAQATADDRILITGIGGGVALFALQLAVALGAEVYVSSGSDDKIEKAISLGAKAGVNYKNEDWEKEISKKAGGHFDVIIDSAGGNGFNKLLKIANPGARMAIYGGSLGAYEKVSPQIIFWKQISILGTSMGSEVDFVNMLQMVNEYKIKPVVAKVFPLSDIAEAFDFMQKGLQFGKIVLDHS